MKPVSNFVILIMKSLSFMFTLPICPILNGYTQVFFLKLLIQTYHTTCVSFSCEFKSLRMSFQFSKTPWPRGSVRGYISQGPRFESW